MSRLRTELRCDTKLEDSEADPLISNVYKSSISPIVRFERIVAIAIVALIGTSLLVPHSPQDGAQRFLVVMSTEMINFVIFF